ncbi:hypothetical protein [Mesorhizobium sp.]|nr:hypothetical protein [Mesorhizobium sp.]
MALRVQRAGQSTVGSRKLVQRSVEATFPTAGPMDDILAWRGGPLVSVLG